MPHYFFDIDDSVSIRDDTGQDCVDLTAAEAEAFRRAADYGGNPANLRKSGVIVVTVRDGPGEAVLKVRLICQVEEHHPRSGSNSVGSMPLAT